MVMFTATADLFSLSFTDTSRVINKFKDDSMKKAVGVFLRATLRKIPYRTGFVRGAFGDMNAYFNGEAGNRPSISRNIFRPKKPNFRKTKYNEYYYTGHKTRILKTPTAGVQFATPVGNVLKQSGDKSTINIDINISYYQINDNFSKITGAPWKSMEAGFTAILNYLETEIKKFPSIDELMVKQKIQLQGSKVTKTTVADYSGRFTPRGVT